MDKSLLLFKRWNRGKDTYGFRIVASALSHEDDVFEIFYPDPFLLSRSPTTLYLYTFLLLPRQYNQ